MNLFLKSIISIILGFLFSIILGFLILPILKKLKMNQSVSKMVNIRHTLKNGTPTMGGIIFIGSTLLVILLLSYLNYLSFSYNFLLIILIFLFYGLLGFLDDIKKIKEKNNDGLSIFLKFIIQIIIAIIFFIIFLLSGNNTIIYIFNYSWDLKCFYGFFILIMLAGFSNAVNITDGLDGLAAGLCTFSFLIYGIIAFLSSYVIGYEEIGIFCFVLSGALLGFLFYNFYPAKVFMGDLGSLALGSTLCAVAIILKSELSILFIGLIYIIEMLSSLLQIICIKKMHKKIFLKSPLHHHFEEKGYKEVEIIKIFYTFNFVIVLIYLIYFILHMFFN